MTEISVVWRDGKQYIKLVREGKTTILVELAKKRLTCEELSQVLSKFDFPDLEVNEHLRRRLKDGETIRALTKEEIEEQRKILEEIKKKLEH